MCFLKLQIENIIIIIPIIQKSFRRMVENVHGIVNFYPNNPNIEIYVVTNFMLVINFEFRF